MECYCYLRTVHDRTADGKTAYEKRFAVTCDGPSTPFGAKISFRPIASRDAAKMRQFCRKMLPDISMGDASRAGWGWSGRSAPSTSRTCQPQDIHVKRFKLQDIAQEGKLLVPRAVGSFKLCDLPQPPRVKSQPRETLSQLKKKKKTPVRKRKTEKYV